MLASPHTLAVVCMKSRGVRDKRGEHRMICTSESVAWAECHAGGVVKSVSSIFRNCGAASSLVSVAGCNRVIAGLRRPPAGGRRTEGVTGVSRSLMEPSVNTKTLSSSKSAAFSSFAVTVLLKKSAGILEPGKW